MSEVLRMRLARAPQRLVNRNVVGWETQPPNPERRLSSAKARKQPAAAAPLLDRLLANPAAAKRTALSYIGSTQFVRQDTELAVPVRELDSWLVERGNRATPAAVTAEIRRLLREPPAKAVAAADWRAERQRVFESLLACIVARTEPALGAELTRLLLIFGLVEALAQNSSPLSNADDVENWLRYRTVLIPRPVLALIPTRARLARRYGFADLYVVRDEWNRYEAGEIAHIENVLPREAKKRALTTLSETEVTTTTESETINTEENDSQTADRMELQQHAQRETDLGVHVAAQVEVEASYGPMHIAATVGGSFDYSQKDAEEYAYRQSHEMVTRAVKRVEERVKTTRATRSLQRTTQENRHSLDNTSSNNVVGIYRWVDKVQRLQLFRYPHRLLLEFQIPEPAAYLAWRRSQPRGDFVTPEPVALVRRNAQFTPILGTDGKPTPLQPSDITEANYQWWVAQYNVMGVSSPPAPRLEVSTILEMKEQVPAGSGGGGGGGGSSTANASVTDKSVFDVIAAGTSGSAEPGVAIPSGYRLESWEVSGYASNAYMLFDGWQEGAHFRPDINVMVGVRNLQLQRGPSVTILSLLETNPRQTPLPPYNTWQFGGSVPATTYPANAPVTGIVPVSGRIATAKECRLHVRLVCARMPEGLVRWQQQTYEQISAAYWGLRRQRADEEAARAVGQGVGITGDSPARNKEVILEELKRGVVEMLTGANLQGRNGMQSVPADQPPQVDLNSAVAIAEEIQFIEQAFEWENLTYVLYPYFWARGERWPELAEVNLADPEFARFLRSGSARVVVPARPKFENQVRMYVDFGALWGGGPAPAVNDPEYLSVAAEIMAQQSPPDDGEKRRSWEVRLPTTLVWLDDNNALPKLNLSPTLEKPPGTSAP